MAHLMYATENTKVVVLLDSDPIWRQHGNIVKRTTIEGKDNYKDEMKNIKHRI